MISRVDMGRSQGETRIQNYDIITYSIQFLRNTSMRHSKKQEQN